MRSVAVALEERKWGGEKFSPVLGMQNLKKMA
jgi:hypothetical protein